jgi:hypothetical protein
VVYALSQKKSRPPVLSPLTLPSSLLLSPLPQSLLLVDHDNERSNAAATTAVATTTTAIATIYNKQ